MDGSMIYLKVYAPKRIQCPMTIVNYILFAILSFYFKTQGS